MPRTPPEAVTPERLRGWALPEPEGSKYGRGTVMVVGGARSTPGAAMLAGLAALRVGAGVLTLAVAASVAPAVAAAVPEASVLGLAEDADGAVTGLAAVGERLGQADAVLVGPGLDEPDGTGVVVREVFAALAGSSTTVLLDAFALGVLPDVIADERPGGALLLSPNAKEAARLLREDPDRLGTPPEVARAIAERYAATVTYERHIAEPAGPTWVVPAGHSGLGTSGSGDVLAGATAGLSARRAEPAQAACWATYLHSAGGDRLAARVGRLGFLARELVEELPHVLTELEA
jgi:ADP-dependent NAD(P)H-hydrate dehydratase